MKEKGLYKKRKRSPALKCSAAAKKQHQELLVENFHPAKLPIDIGRL